MKKFLMPLLLFILVSSGPLLAQDTCESAVDATGGGAFSGNTYDFHNYYDPSSSPAWPPEYDWEMAGPDYVFEINVTTLPAGNEMSASVSALFDVALYVIRDCSDPAGSLIAAADNPDDSVNQEELTFSVTEKGLYYIVVDSYYEYARGPFNILVNTSSGTPPDPPVVPDPTPTPTPSPTVTPTPTTTPTPPVYEILTWDCPVSDGWQKTQPVEDGTYIDAADGAFYIATHVSGPCIIGAGGDDPGQSTFGQWKSIHDQIPYLSGNVYRLRYTLSTDQTDREQVPNVRLFADCVDAPDTKLASNGGMRIGRGIFAPDTNGETYNVYFGPPDLSGTEISHIRLNFEVIDFSPEELGTNFLEKVEVERFPTPDISEGAPVTSYSGSGFSEWTSNTPGAPFGTATAGSDSSGLYLTTPGPYNTDAINYGLWYLDANSPTAVTFQADLLYRAVFRVSTPDPAEVDTVGKIRVFTQNRAANWTSLLVLDPSFLTNHMPTVAGRDYDVWFESPPQLYGNDDDRMSFSFDISDGKDDQEGTVYLNELRIYTYDIPPM